MIEISMLASGHIDVLACMVCNLTNFHMLFESVNVTMKSAINFYDMTTLRYIVCQGEVWGDVG